MKYIQIKKYQRKGQPNEGYGSKGQVDFQVHFVRTNELARNEKWDKFYDVKEYYTSDDVTEYYTS